MAQQPYAPWLRRLLDAAPWLRRAVQWLEGAALGVVWWGLGRLSPDRASAWGRRLLASVGPRWPKSRHVRRNLATALPERSPAEVDALVREVWGGLGAALAEYPHLHRITAEEGRIEIVQEAELEVLRRPGRPAVFVSAHLANWELSVLAASRLGVPLTVLYAPDANPWIERRIRAARAALGCHFAPREGGVRRLVRALAEGRSVGLVVDTRMDDGEPVPFFGRPALTTTVPARLALRHGCELVPVRVERLGGARFRVTIHAPVRPDDPEAPRAEQARQMTRRIHEHFERWIRESPGDWLCLKRRWPEPLREALPPGHVPAAIGS
jgi:KDO2-lipid IV(A) lauroyltransferase